MDTTRTRRQALLTLAVTITVEVVAAVGLVALGRSPSASIDTRDLGRWLDTTPLVDVAFALLRLVALALVAYLLATTLVYVLARLTRLPGLVRAVAPLTLPSVRRIADRAVAGSLVTATLVGGVPAGATALEAPPRATVSVTESGALLPPGVRAPADTGRSDRSPDVPIPTPRPGGVVEADDGSEARPDAPIPTPRPGATEDREPSRRAPIPTPRTGDAPEDARESGGPRTTHAPSAPAPDAPEPRPAPDTTAPMTPRTPEAPRVAPARPGAPRVTVAPPAHEAAAGPAATGTWVAARGDSLWHIAEHVVADALGVAVGEVADAQVADYWHALVAANRDRVGSGDVDIVAIGERIVLPPLERS